MPWAATPVSRAADLSPAVEGLGMLRLVIVGTMVGVGCSASSPATSGLLGSSLLPKASRRARAKETAGCAVGRRSAPRALSAASRAARRLFLPA